MGFEPHDLRVMSPTSYQTAPLRDIDGAGSRGRTGTRVESHGILSPGRLPIPPFRHIRSSVLLNYYITCDRDCQPFFAYFLKKSPDPYWQPPPNVLSLYAAFRRLKTILPKIRRNISPFGEDARQGEYAKHKFQKIRRNIEAVTMGRRAKTINNYFCEAETAPSNEPAEQSVSRR